MGRIHLNRTVSVVKEKSLGEFVYSIIMTLTKEQKDALPMNVRRKINTVNRARRFVDRSSTDQKRELMSYLDISSYLVFHPAGARGAQQFLEVMELFKTGNVAHAIREAVKHNIYVSSDKEYSFYMGFMSHCAGNPPYIQNQELRRAAEAINEWPVKLAKHKGDIQDIDSTAIDNLLFSVGVGWSSTRETIGLTYQQTIVLYYFNNNRNKYIEISTLREAMSGFVNMRSMTIVVQDLLKEQLIQKHFDHSKMEYTITKFGVKRIAEFRAKAVKKI